MGFSARLDTRRSSSCCCGLSPSRKPALSRSGLPRPARSAMAVSIRKVNESKTEYSHQVNRGLHSCGRKEKRER